jgi:hypothetical protein
VKRCHRTWWAMLLIVGLAAPLAACGDDTGDGDGVQPDAPPDIDGPEPDGPTSVTFTRFVIDLVQNRTAGNTDPVPFAEFSSLEDPDTENPGAYDALFQ